VRSRAEGSAQLTASYQGVTKTTRVSVRAVVASVAIAGVTDTALVYVRWPRAFSAAARDSNGNALQRTITWASGNPRAATIDASGALQAIALGQTLVTAAADSRADSVMVNVALAPVAQVAVVPGFASLVPGGSLQLTDTTKDARGNVLSGRTVAWSSDVTRVVNVSPSGLAQAFSGGIANVAATSEGVSGAARISVEALAANPVSVTDTVLWGSGATTTAAVRVTNAGTAVLSGLSVTIAYPPSIGFAYPQFVTGASLSSGTTPSTLTLRMSEPQFFCSGYNRATVTIWSSTPGITPVDVPIAHFDWSPTGC
jgi:hypothetical protein